MLVDFSDETIVKDYVSREEVIQRIAYVRDRLNFRTIYSHYGLHWLSDDDHQFPCPFHGADRHPSSHYYPNPPRVWCFACSEGGDVVWWVKQKNGFKSMVDALDYISKEFGIGFDSGDLSKRIQLLETNRADPKRKLMIDRLKDKVNDLLYEVRHHQASKQKRWDALEMLIFNRFNQLSDTAALPYMTAVQLHRDWAAWAGSLVHQVSKEQ